MNRKNLEMDAMGVEVVCGRMKMGSELIESVSVETKRVRGQIESVSASIKSASVATESVSVEAKGVSDQSKSVSAETEMVNASMKNEYDKMEIDAKRIKLQCLWVFN